MFDKKLWVKESPVYREWLIENKEKLKEYRKNYHREYYLRNKVKIVLKNKLYAKNHPERMVKTVQRYVLKNKEKVSAYNIKFSKSFAGKYRLLTYRHKKRNWTDKIMSFEDFCEVSNKPCYYCNGDSKRGIDRVNNELGYSLTNSVPCCETCNHIKWNLNQKNFFAHISKIYKNIFNDKKD